MGIVRIEVPEVQTRFNNIELMGDTASHLVQLRRGPAYPHGCTMLSDAYNLVIEQAFSGAERARYALPTHGEMDPGPDGDYRHSPGHKYLKEAVLAENKRSDVDRTALRRSSGEVQEPGGTLWGQMRVSFLRRGSY